ncbi:MAG: MCE family protein [Spirochaetes bacterium]|nr:MCE family protein [Spirochaetota bacterium]
MNEKELDQQVIKKIGIIFISTSIISLFLVIFLFTRSFIGSYYPVKVRFNFIADLKKGAEVKFIGGPEVGYVRSIDKYNQKVELTLNIRKSFLIRENAEISLYTHGMMGERYIEINQAPEDGSYIEPGTILTGNDAMSMEILQLNLARLTEQMIYSKIKDDKPPKDFVTILKDLAFNLKVYSGNIKNIRPESKASILNFQKNTEEIIIKVNEAKQFAKNLRKDLKTVSKDQIKSFFSFLYEIESDVVSLNESIPGLLKTAETLKIETGLIANEKSFLGKLIFDSKEYDNILSTMEDLEDYSEEIADNPRQFLFK